MRRTHATAKLQYVEESIEFEVTLERSAEEVWSLVTDPAALGTWMIGTFDFEAIQGSPLVFRTEDQIRRGEVVDVEAERRFAWRWNDGNELSEVAITIDDEGGSSRVRISERLLPPRSWAKPSIPPVEASIA